jgi:hypothetical protein
MRLKFLKQLSERRLKRKIVFHLLRNPASDPAYVIMRAEHIYRYITGTFPKKELDACFDATE